MAVYLRHRNWQVAYVSGRKVCLAGHLAILGLALIRFVYRKGTVSRCTGEEERKLLNLEGRLGTLVDVQVGAQRMMSRNRYQ